MSNSISRPSSPRRSRGWASDSSEARGENMDILFQTIIDQVAPPSVDRDGPFRMQVSALDYSSYVGVIGIGRIERGHVKRNAPISIIGADGAQRQGRMLQILGFHGLERVEREEAAAGDIIAFSGFDELHISDTLCDPAHVEALPALTVDQPTISMTFQVNDSPFAGRGEVRHQPQHSRSAAGRTAPQRRAAGRGHGFRRPFQGLGARRTAPLDPDREHAPRRLRTGDLPAGSDHEEVDGVVHEPWETLTVDVEEEHQGSVMELLGTRKAELKGMEPDGNGRVRLDYLVPTRGLIGIRSIFLTQTSGSGLMYHAFDHYGPRVAGELAQRQRGVLISTDTGMARAYALFNLQERGQLMLGHGADVYEGMIIGIHSRANDLMVNPLKAKQLTNIRAAGTDENLVLTTPVQVTLEYALEFIDDDELVEVTPDSIRIRKKFLKEHERKKGQPRGLTGAPRIAIPRRWPVSSKTPYAGGGGIPN